MGFCHGSPARRQQAYRTARIALTCPLVRPAEVPIDGCYFPLPPPEARDKKHDGTLADNYLYKTYLYKGTAYPQGLWILELTSFKTDETYGVYTMLLPERHFEDGSTFYQHLDHYLCGLVAAGGKKKVADLRLVGPPAQRATRTLGHQGQSRV
jgi:hypothetical protein